MNKKLGYHSSWLKCCAKQLYGAMVVMKVLFFNCDSQCFKDVLRFQKLTSKNKDGNVV